MRSTRRSSSGSSPTGPRSRPTLLRPLEARLGALLARRAARRLALGQRRRRLGARLAVRLAGVVLLAARGLAALGVLFGLRLLLRVAGRSAVALLRLVVAHVVTARVVV